MAIVAFNGVQLYWALSGEGAPLVLVHGSWGDHRNWDAAAPLLAQTSRVVRYDRRGHSQSERLPGRGSIQEDVADLAALIIELGLAPAHVAGNSFGATIVLKLAAVRPDLIATLTVHEPPLIALLGDDPSVAGVQQRIAAVVAMLQSGDMEGGARQFVETVAFGPSMWEQLPPGMRQTFVFNAPTWLDEVNEPAAFTLDVERLAAFHRPALLTGGSESPPFFRDVLNRVAAALPHAQRHTFAGAGHVPHVTQADDYARVVSDFIRAAQTA